MKSTRKLSVFILLSPAPKKELTKVFEFAEQKLGAEQSKIFEAQLLILEDTILFEAVYERLKRERKNAEYIMKDEMEKYHQLMMASKDEYARERADDLLDVENRILRNLEEQKLISKIEGTHVIISHNLAAADTLIFSRNDVLAYVTELGGATSHMALLARALKIPAVVGIHQLASLVAADDRIVVDGYSGAIVLNPNHETLRFYKKEDTTIRLKMPLRLCATFLLKRLTVTMSSGCKCRAGRGTRIYQDAGCRWYWAVW